MKRWETAVVKSATEHPGTISGYQVTGVWRAALLAGAAGVFLIGQAGVADAQFAYPFRYREAPPNRVEPPVREDSRSRRDTNTRKSGRAGADKSKRDVAIRHPFGENTPKGPLQLMISISDQRAVLYSNGMRVAESRVSTGVPQHPTPTGIFSIIQKNRWHRSNIYSNAPMYYMHRLTWSGIALHEGHLPGYAASHGCIRMPTDFVSRLWGISKLGMRVVVARASLTPHDFTHEKLFNPAQKPADTSRTSEMPADLRPSIDTTGQGGLRVAQAQPAVSDSATTSDAPNAAEMSGGSDAATSTVVIPAAQQTPVPAVPAVTPAAGAPAAATDPDKPAIDPNELSLPRPAPLRTRAAEPAKLNGQVAVFISGKEKRIYVRHAFVPVFDMPIEIANPGKPLGTHTFTALETVDGGTRMRWNLVSMPLTAMPPAAASKKGAAKQQPQRPKFVRGAVITSESSNATDALDRVTIPPEAVERISELLTPGSSLIISDEGLGRETGRYTEFIVETR
jgi:lipoprotein-anchoring transpeptidase ErfK/SrfK